MGFWHWDLSSSPHRISSLVTESEHPPHQRTVTHTIYIAAQTIEPKRPAILSICTHPCKHHLLLQSSRPLLPVSAGILAARLLHRMQTRRGNTLGLEHRVHLLAVVLSCQLCACE